MYFLFSGEGATDLGLCSDNCDACEGGAYDHGPMTIIVDQVVAAKLGYSILEGGHYGYVSKRALVARAKKELKAIKKAVRLPGKKQPKETRYFFDNARALARIAAERGRELDDEVVAVLFRDSDGTASAGRGLWKDKRQSMIDGFEAEGTSRGVPMIPKPKSEAWIICAVKPHPYQACEKLEERSGNDDSPSSLKSELKNILREQPSREILSQLLVDREINIDRISMPSFRAFRERLEEVIWSQPH